MRSLWVNGFGAGGPPGESVQKAGVSGRAAQGRKREQERKLLPGLVWRVGGKDENREGPCQGDTGGERRGSEDRQKVVHPSSLGGGRSGAVPDAQPLAVRLKGCFSEQKSPKSLKA